MKALKKAHYQPAKEVQLPYVDSRLLDISLYLEVRNPTYHHQTLKDFWGSLKSIWEKSGRSTGKASTLMPSFVRASTTSLNTILFPLGVRCKPSLQITCDKTSNKSVSFLSCYSHFFTPQQPYAKMQTTIKFVIVLQYLKKALSQPGNCCILDHRSTTGMPHSPATEMQAFA